MSIFTIYHSM